MIVSFHSSGLQVYILYLWFFCSKKKLAPFSHDLFGRFLGSKKTLPQGSAAGELCKKSIDAVKGDLPMAPWRFFEIRRWQIPPKGKM